MPAITFMTCSLMLAFAEMEEMCRENVKRGSKTKLRIFGFLSNRRTVELFMRTDG